MIIVSHYMMKFIIIAPLILVMEEHFLESRQLEYWEGVRYLGWGSCPVGEDILIHRRQIAGRLVVLSRQPCRVSEDPSWYGV